jgi:hypothetical protein
MTPEQIAEVIAYLQGLGEAAVAKGFELAVKQVYVEIAGYTGWVIASILLLFFGIGLLIWRKKNPKSYDRDIAAIMGFVCIAISIVGVLSQTYQIAARLINPEWYAIKGILELL